MKRKLITLFAACASVLIIGCSKPMSQSEIILHSVSQVEFGAEGGFGTAVIDAAGGTIAATSSEPEWLRVRIVGESVLFNVFSYSGSTDRQGKISVTSGKLKPAEFTVTQKAFHGISVSAHSLTFSNDSRTMSVAVSCTSDFSVEMSENPDNLFSFRKTATGVEFTADRGPSRDIVKARAHLIPEDKTIEPLIITLIMPERPVADYLPGEWTVMQNTEPGGDTNPMTFIKKTDNTFEVKVSNADIAENPFTATLTSEGKVKIASGQQLGQNSAGKYVSLHFNGTKNGSGWYIFQAANFVAWEATPVFDWENKTITLAFADNGQDQNGNVAVFMAIWQCTANYFSWGTGSLVSGYRQLVLTKQISEQ